MTPHGHESHPLGPPVGNAAAPDPVPTSGVGERGKWDWFLGQLFEDDYDPNFGHVRPEDEGYQDSTLDSLGVEGEGERSSLVETPSPTPCDHPIVDVVCTLCSKWLRQEHE